MNFEEFINAHKSKLKILGGFMLVFVLGFSCGYSYLDRNKPATGITVRDDSGSCAALLKQSAASSLQAGADQVSASGSDSTGTVLAEKTSADTSGSNAVVKAFAGSKNSTLYHTKDCQYVKRIKAENLVWFSSQQEAEAAGRKPHSCVGGE